MKIKFILKIPFIMIILEMKVAFNQVMTKENILSILKDSGCLDHFLSHFRFLLEGGDNFMNSPQNFKWIGPYFHICIFSTS